MVVDSGRKISRRVEGIALVVPFFSGCNDVNGDAVKMFFFFFFFVVFSPLSPLYVFFYHAVCVCITLRWGVSFFVCGFFVFM